MACSAQRLAEQGHGVGIELPGGAKQVVRLCAAAAHRGGKTRYPAWAREDTRPL